MRNYFLAFCLFGILHANQYDYLLFSNVVSDVESGLKLQADVNAVLMNTTPLHYAVMNNNLQTAYMLLDNGANVNAKINGLTPLHIACQVGNVAMVRLLLNAGADVNAKDSQYGNTPLHYAALTANAQILNILTLSKANTKAENNMGLTPSQILVRNITIPPLVIEDSNLAVSASAFKTQNGMVAFSVRNLTNRPLRIFYMRLYVNGVLFGEFNRIIDIPAGTAISNSNTMLVSPNIIYALKPDDNGVLNIKAGFSIGYNAEGINQEVFNSNQLAMKLWNLPNKNKNDTKK